MRLPCALLIIATTCLSGYAQQERKSPPKSPFESWDANADGALSPAEFPKRFSKALFDRIDSNKDGKITRKEDDAYRARNAQRNKPAKLPSNVTAKRDITYAAVGDRKLPLDLYYVADSDKPTPLVIWIHGGGWQAGSKKGYGPAGELLNRGYAVASVEYRLSGEAKFPAAVDDCKAAVSFLRANAKQFNIDPDRFGVWGSSAGGHLAAMVGTTGDTDQFEGHDVAKQTDSVVQAVCDWFGPTDFNRMNDVKGKIDHDSATSPESKFIGAPIQDNADLVAKANPITYVSPADPPFLIMHGEVDDMVPYAQSELLQAALTKSDVQSELIMIKSGNHGFGGAAESREELAQKSADFFDRILKADK